MHALSNNMTSSTHSSDKHSPHTSPRFSRRSTTPSLMAVQNDLYAGHIPSLSLANPSVNYITAASAITGTHSPSAPPINALNGSNSSTSVISSSASTVMASSVTSTTTSQPQSSQKSTNRMSAPLMGTNAAVIPGYASKMTGKSDSNDNSNSSYAILQNLQESQAIIAKEAQKREANSAAVASVAPPLPPRKSSPGVENSLSSMASPNVIGSNGHTNGCGAIQKTPCILPQTSKSVDNLAASLGDISVPKTTAPPIPPHNTSSNVDTLVEELRTQRITTSLTSNLVSNNSATLLDDDIVGPAETIMGVIDTRPLEARSSTSNYTQLCTTTTTNSSSSSLRSELKNHNEKLNEVPKQIQNHHQQQHHQKQHQQQPLLYENVSINQKGDCSVPYENINLEYIARLMNEGYSKENAITALGISRNNIEMACDILREFVAKNSV